MSPSIYWEAPLMATSRTRRRPGPRRTVATVGKPRGVLHPRVQQVGPDHFGIVCFDCAKARSKFLLADFYGRVLIPPTTVAHNRPDLDDAVAQVRQAFASHQLHDGLVAIERTGRYHRLVQRTFAAAGFETRILHPFVTKQYRQPVDPGTKTDDTDLAALHRATVTGCALLEATRDAAWTTWPTADPPPPRSGPQRRRPQLPDPRSPRSGSTRLRCLLRPALGPPRRL